MTGPAHSRAAQLWMWVLWSSVGWTFRRECVKAVGGGLVEFLIEKRKYGRHQNSMVLITYYCSVQSGFLVLHCLLEFGQTMSSVGDAL